MKISLLRDRKTNKSYETTSREHKNKNHFVLALRGVGTRKGKLKRSGAARAALIENKTMQRIEPFGAQEHAKVRVGACNAQLHALNPRTEVRNRAGKEEEEIRKEEVIS